jgi:Alpha-glucuronidase
MFALATLTVANAEDGYRLWLRYDRIEDAAYVDAAARALAHITFATPDDAESPTIAVARDELTAALNGLLGFTPEIRLQKLPAHDSPADPRARSGFTLHASPFTLSSPSDRGILYGVFHLIRLLQTRQPLDNLSLSSYPKIQYRLLNHWDNLDGFIERGAAGHSLWNWFELPDYVSPRLRDYARANASIGINGAVLTNVNANALVLTPDYLRKAAVIADTFRPYGIQIFLTARFSAPVEIGGLKTSDPHDPEVIAWWREKANEIYRAIPDFGGFLVKANSEGQPGPQAYGRTHAEGANLLADALAPHGGIVMWRAFVYDNNVPDDRAKQAFNEFKPLDGKFRANVVVQIKNGPIDFMPREPFHPLFGAMPRTPLALELQIAQEYLGGANHLAFLAPLFKETLDADTFTSGKNSSVARIVDGSLDGRSLSVIAGVANTGDSRNWTGHPLAQANWYAFGRLAWDHTLSAETIADEWARQTFSNDSRVVSTLVPMLLTSRETVVDYSMPLGLHHIMAEGHHYGPGPWVADAGRADWTSTYYHRADKNGLGFDRTATGSNAIAQYAPPVARIFGSLTDCPENLLLWFHHVPWDHRLKSGNTLWDELCRHYQRGVDSVRAWQKSWAELAPLIDAGRHAHVAALLARQEREAREWRDACVLYFQTFSQCPLPDGIEPAEYPLSHYMERKLRYVPGDPAGR